MRSPLLILLIVLPCLPAIAGCGGSGPMAQALWKPQSGNPPKVKVVSSNLYYGTELDEAMAGVLAGDPEQIIAGVSVAYDRLVATDFHTRAQALAEAIQAEEPDLIGLQEAALWRTQVPSDTFTAAPTPATDVAYDFVEILQTALAAYGLTYDVAAEFTGFDVEFPRLNEAYALEDVRLTDREVILVNRDSKARISNPQTGAFDINIVFPSGFEILRGWAAVDVTVKERTFRFVSTHLEADHPDVRLAQAAEILQGPTATHLPVVLVGDFNYDLDAPGAEGTSIFLALLQSAGFSLLAPGTAGDSTCCHDELLVDAAATLTERLDLVLHRGPYETTHQRILDPRQDGLWGSDHAAVYAKIRLTDEP